MSEKKETAAQVPATQMQGKSVAARRSVTGAPGSVQAVVLDVKKPISKLTESEFYTWLIQFAPVFATLADGLGFAKSVVDSALNDAAWANYITLRETGYARSLDLVRLFRNTFYEGIKQGQDTPAVAADITEPVRPENPMQAGVYIRMLNLVTQIRKSPAFNEVIAAQLGLDWKPGNGQKPSEVGLEMFQSANGPELRWKKAGIRNGAAYFEYDPSGKGEAANFVYLQTATKSPLALVPNFPEGVSAAIWSVRYCMIEDNKPTGDWSNVVNVTVSTVVNKPAANRPRG